MLEFLVCGGGGEEETTLVAGCEAADYTCACDGCVDNWDNIGEFGFEDTVGRQLEVSCGDIRG